MAEEQRCQSPPEGPPLCANNCGFFGSPATLGLCSKCYRDHRHKEEQEASAKTAVEKTLLASSSSSSSSSSSATVLSSAATPVDPALLAPAPPPETCPTHLLEAPEPASAVVVQPGRCTSCSKRVGLTGFRCRCGATFCSRHRHPEQHGCAFDFKTAGREALARANPVVKADKLEKI